MIQKLLRIDPTKKETIPVILTIGMSYSLNLYFVLIWLQFGSPSDYLRLYTSKLGFLMMYIICSINDMAPNRRHGITWTNADQYALCHMVSLEHNMLSSPGRDSILEEYT